MTQRSWPFHISSTVNSLTGLDLKYRYFLLRSYFAQFIGLCFINAIFFFFFFNDWYKTLYRTIPIFIKYVNTYLRRNFVRIIEHRKFRNKFHKSMQNRLSYFDSGVARNESSAVEFVEVATKVARANSWTIRRGTRCETIQRRKSMNEPLMLFNCLQHASRWLQLMNADCRICLVVLS